MLARDGRLTRTRRSPSCRTLRGRQSRGARCTTRRQSTRRSRRVACAGPAGVGKPVKSPKCDSACSVGAVVHSRRASSVLTTLAKMVAQCLHLLHMEAPGAQETWQNMQHKGLHPPDPAAICGRRCQG